MQMFYDDLPIWGFIGKVEKIMSQSTKSWEKHELKYYLFTHIHFDILYNGDRVIEVNVSTDPSRTVEITEGENVIVDWTYSVKWRETSIPFEKRMDKYSRYSFLPQHLEVTARPSVTSLNHGPSLDFQGNAPKKLLLVAWRSQLGGGPLFADKPVTTSHGR